MKTNISRRGLFRAVGETTAEAVGLAILAGCAAKYTSNSSKVGSVKFGDRYFDSKAYLTGINERAFIWTSLSGFDVRIKGHKLAPGEYFPLAAFDVGKLHETVDPEANTVTYSYPGNAATIFMKDHAIETINTGYKAGPLPKVKSGQAKRIKESPFEVDLLEFDIQGLEGVGFSEDTDTGEIILTPSPQYRINHARGRHIDYIPKHGAFVEQMGRISVTPAPKPKPAPRPAPKKEPEPLPNPIKAKVIRRKVKID